jgi:hypothetical protein
MRYAISASQRLSATLRILAAGQVFEDLQSTTGLFRVLYFNFLFPVVGAQTVHYLHHSFPFGIRIYSFVLRYKFVVSFVFLFRSEYYFDLTCP